MSPQPSSLSPDLQRLQDEGYGVAIEFDHLVVSTPYVNSRREVKWGGLFSTLEMGGDQTTPPDIHVVFFAGEAVDDYPCDSNGNKLTGLIHQEGPCDLGNGLIMTCGFSQRPTTARNDYENYHDKMSTYVGMLQAEAQAIDPSVSYRDFPPIATQPNESVFRYADSATTRARIGAVVDKIRGQRVAIVGLGGSGSYILDAVAKTPVAEIHLFDDDTMLTHNAFRAPGAPTLELLNARPLKAEHHQTTYDAMHRHVIAHPERITAENTDLLAGFNFVFISMDASSDKLAIFEILQQQAVPFVDTGMGVYQRGSSIGGIVRTSLSTPKQSDPAWINSDSEISFIDDAENDYDQNIQIAELNMLNAALAVIAWKKYFGFYFDFEHERSSVYTIDGNHLLNEVSA